MGGEITYASGPFFLRYCHCGWSVSRHPGQPEPPCAKCHQPIVVETFRYQRRGPEPTQFTLTNERPFFASR